MSQLEAGASKDAAYRFISRKSYILQPQRNDLLLNHSICSTCFLGGGSMLSRQRRCISLHADFRFGVKAMMVYSLHAVHFPYFVTLDFPWALRMPEAT